MLNRLVTSACETFVSSPLDKDGGKDAQTEKNPSPSTSRPNSILDNGLPNSWKADLRADDTHHRKIISQDQILSHSHGSLMNPLQVGKGELHGRNRLKYQSDGAVNSSGYQILQDKDDRMQAYVTLIPAGRDGTSRSSAVSEDGMDMHVTNELESSLSEPDLHRGTVYTNLMGLYRCFVCIWHLFSLCVHVLD